MQSMSVNPAQVTALASEIRNGANGIRTQLDNLNTEVTKLRGQWGGDAQQSYDAAQRSWNQSVTAMQELLSQIATKTEEISSGYVQSDNSSAGRFNA
jgi:early secretory antigenic target protein ESAT-6